MKKKEWVTSVRGDNIFLPMPSARKSGHRFARKKKSENGPSDCKQHRRASIMTYYQLTQPIKTCRQRDKERTDKRNKHYEPPYKKKSYGNYCEET